MRHSAINPAGQKQIVCQKFILLIPKAKFISLCTENKVKTFTLIQLLAATIQNEKPELEVRKTELLKTEEYLKIQLAKMEESLLEVLWSSEHSILFIAILVTHFHAHLTLSGFQELANAKGNILENKELLDSLNKTKASSITISDSLTESVRLQTSLDQVCKEWHLVFFSLYN